jgi:outer membrane protein assembly factor BamB
LSSSPGKANAAVAWSVPRGDLEMASPLVYQGQLYVFSQRGGLVTCYEAETGKRLYREHLSGAQSFWASPWAADGKVYGLDQDGTTYVLAAGPEFRLVAENHLDDRFWASPAVGGGSLLLRGVANLYCIKP